METKTDIVTVDAAGKTLGRVASEAANALLGKHSVNFAKNIVVPTAVKVINAGKMRLTEQRRKETIYKHYTGYPGGLREETLGMFLEKKGIAEVIKKTVDGMIPRNKLRAPRMKRLEVTI